MIHLNFIRRQLTTARQQSLIFVLCVALAIVTLVGLNSFGSSINRTLLNDAQELLAADAVIDSSYPFSEPVVDALADLAARNQIDYTQLTGLFTVARLPNEENSLLVDLKAVEVAYPFYGEAVLASGRALHDVLEAGTIVVEELILDRLGLQVGDALRLGDATLTIGDVLVSEPDRPVNFFAFGPRVMLAADDLPQLNLIREGSNVDYRMLVRVNDGANLESVTSALDSAADPVLERVSNYRTRDSGLQQFFDNLLFFLSLVAIFTLLLAGIGIQSALTAFLRERDNTIAIVKTVGATSRFVTTNFLIVIALLALVGTALGLVGGLAFQQLFPLLLGDFLPPDVEIVISPLVIGQSLLLSAIVVAIFTYLPVDRLKELRPSFILRKETVPAPRDLSFYAILALLVLAFAGLVLWQLGDLERTSWFVLGALGVVLISWLVTEGVLFLLRRSQVKPLAMRQALRGLFRPRNATRAIIVTLSASLAVIFTIYLIEQNLDAAFVQSFPDDAPNVFFIDIQPDQREDFAEALAAEIPDDVGAEFDQQAEYIPIVRGQIAAINGEPIDIEQEEARDGDDLARPRVFTYAEELPETESLRSGSTLFNDAVEGAQVSVLDEIFFLRRFEVGETITFRVQGIPLEATITSIRTQQGESVGPPFDFLFRPADLAAAPQTIFAAARLPEAQIAPLQNAIVAQFPNVSVINATEAVTAFADVARQLSQIVRVLTALSVAAGVLIITSSVYATRLARVQEAAYFKVLGAKSRFVLRVFAYENLLMGLVAAVVALSLSQVSSWILTNNVFELNYQPQLIASVVLVVITVALVMAVGLLASVPILRSRPIRFLREQGQE